MNKQEILDSLTYFTEDFPREALLAVQSKSVDITAELLESLDYVCQNAEALYEDGSEYFLHIYAMFLLAEFREKRAFPKLAAFLHFSEEYLDSLLGDTLTNNYSALLFSTYDGENIKMLTDVIENQELYEFSRSAALNAYMFLYIEGFITENEFVSYLRFLINDKLIDDESYVTESIVNCIIDCKLVQMIPDVRYLYQQEVIDHFICGAYDSFLDSVFSEEDYFRDKHLINDAVKEMEWWACFKNKKADRKQVPLVDAAKNVTKENARLNMPTLQKSNKVGRNDPCPCGSGKKYKKCCYDKDQQLNVTASSVVRLEDQYDLLREYPKDSLVFKTMFGEEAIEIDIPVYKALHHRAIPLWVKRDFTQENLGKIFYLEEALDLFLEKCHREQISSFDAYDDKFMVHYHSRQWVETLVKLIEDYHSPEIVGIREKALKTIGEFGRTEK